MLLKGVIDMMESLYSQKEVDALREKIARQEAREEGIGIGEAKGEKKGEAKSFWSLVQDKIITKVTAAKKMGITVAEFDKLCEEYSFGK